MACGRPTLTETRTRSSHRPMDRERPGLAGTRPVLIRRHIKRSGLTVYQVPSGPSTVFAGPDGISIRKITDGTSNTIGVVEVDESRAVDEARRLDI